MNNLQFIFDLPIDSVAAVLKDLRVEGLSAKSEKTGLFTRWLNQEDWRPYTQDLMREFLFKPDEREQAILEDQLAEAEQAFDEFLQECVATDKASADRLRTLLEKLDDLKEKICQQATASHETYPWFVRWFTLHMAVIGSLMLFEDQKKRANIAAIKVWTQGLAYLGQAAESAYHSRLRHIEVRATVLEPRHYFLFDKFHNLPLSEPQAVTRALMSAQCRLTGARRARDYILRSGLHVGFRSLQIIGDSLVIHDDSPLKGEDMKQPVERWRGFIREINSESEYLNTELSAFRELSAVSPAPEDTSRTTKSAGEFFVELASLASLLPIPGANAIGMIGLFVEWLLPNTQPDWDQMIAEIDALIEAKLEDFEQHQIEQEVAAGEDMFDRFLREFEADDQKPEPGEELPAGHYDKLLDIISQCEVTKQKIFNPHAGVMASMAYFQRWFIMYLSVLVTARTHPIPSIGVSGANARMVDLFKDTNDYFDQATLEITQQEDRNATVWEDSNCCTIKTKTNHWQINHGSSSVTPELRANPIQKEYVQKVKEYVRGRGFLIHFSKLVFDQPIRTASRLMEAAHPSGWDGVTPQKIYEEQTLPYKFDFKESRRRRIDELQKLESDVGKLLLNLQPDDDAMSDYLNPERLPKTGLDPKD